MQILRNIPSIPTAHLEDSFMVLYEVVPGITNILDQLRNGGQSLMIDFPSAVRLFVQRDGYINNNVQDVLLQTFGDSGFSLHVNAQTDAFRQVLPVHDPIINHAPPALFGVDVPDNNISQLIPIARSVLTTSEII